MILRSCHTFTGSPIEFVIFQISLGLLLRFPSASIFTRGGALVGIFQFGNQHTEELPYQKIFHYGEISSKIIIIYDNINLETNTQRSCRIKKL